MAAAILITEIAQQLTINSLSRWEPSNAARLWPIRSLPMKRYRTDQQTADIRFHTIPFERICTTAHTVSFYVKKYNFLF